jgi:putative redox protein
MVTITADYRGNLRCAAQHGPSAATLLTDAPKDNQGEGASFSPTDLVATAALTCAMTIIGIYGRTHGLDLAAMTGTVTKDMTATPPRRIARLGLTLRIPGITQLRHRQGILTAARGCPVLRSLGDGVEVALDVLWE